MIIKWKAILKEAALPNCIHFFQIILNCQETKKFFRKKWRGVHDLFCKCLCYSRIYKQQVNPSFFYCGNTKSRRLSCLRITHTWGLTFYHKLFEGKCGLEMNFWEIIFRSDQNVIMVCDIIFWRGKFQQELSQTTFEYATSHWWT